jgi:hypothetical protein
MEWLMDHIVLNVDTIIDLEGGPVPRWGAHDKRSRCKFGFHPVHIF